MNKTQKELTDWIDSHWSAPDLVPEILDHDSTLTPLEAYQVQRERMQRAAANGDKIIGYKAALTSKAMQEQSGVGEPVLGTMLGSRLFAEEAPISLSGFIKSTLEPEVGVLMKTELKGPGVTAFDAMAAIAGYLPCMEIGDIRTGENKRSLQQTIVCNTFNGGHVFGGPLVAPHGLDLRVEGMVMTVNGTVRASATAVEVLGDPLRSVAFMANKLAEIGESLKPGMLLMTGSIVKSIPLHFGDDVHIGFTNLGTVRARFVK